jgi:hypothetical protein
MNNRIKLIVMGVCVLNISSCSMVDNEYPTYPAYSYDSTQSYTLSNYNMSSYDYKYSQKQDVVVPDSYHVGELHSPVSFKDRDQTWVNSQNPQGYTIELAEGDKASKVAQTLYKAPKGDRMAQVKYERDGKTYYKGVYGTYNTSEEAQKALNGLPADVKSSAAVINWSNVQQ